MNVLLVYPEYPPTYWSFRYAVRFQFRKASYPPLGLMTITPYFPAHWKRKLVDLNVRPLKDKDLQWADVVMISAMIVQKKSVLEVIGRARAFGKKIVAGGPLWAKDSSEDTRVDHVIQGEAEEVISQLVSDLENGCAREIYAGTNLPDLTKTPLPDLSLIRLKDYSSMLLQFSRGCPFNCEFCDIIEIFGRKARTKTQDQFLTE